MFLFAKLWIPGGEKSISWFYSLVKMAFAPICSCKNNKGILHHNVITSHSHDVTDQLWWRHDAKSEKTVLVQQWGNGTHENHWQSTSFVTKKLLFMVTHALFFICSINHRKFERSNLNFELTKFTPWIACGCLLWEVQFSRKLLINVLF